MARVTYSKSGRANYTSTSSEYSAEIVGLKAFARALKKVSDEYPKALRDANYELGQNVAEHAKLRAIAEGRQAYLAAQSIRAMKTTNAAMLTAGGARMPYFFGAEFGAKKFGQFQPWRGNQWGGWEGGPGYFLHPTLREEAQSLIDAYMDHLQRLSGEAFPEE